MNQKATIGIGVMITVVASMIAIYIEKETDLVRRRVVVVSETENFRKERNTVEPGPLMINETICSGTSR